MRELHEIKQDHTGFSKVFDQLYNIADLMEWRQSWTWRQRT